MCGGCGAVVWCGSGVKGGEVIMVRPEGADLEEGGVVGAGGKEQVVWRVRPEGSNLEGAGG